MPINLAGGYAAGGVKDALLEIVKQRMLEQELAQREEENQFQRLRANRQDTAQEARDKAAEAQRAIENARLDAAAKLNAGEAQLKALDNSPFKDLVDPTTQGFGPNAKPAIGLPPLPGTNVAGVSPPAVQQGEVKPVDIGGRLIKPRTAEQNAAAAIQTERSKALNTAYHMNPGDVVDVPSMGRIAESGPAPDKWELTTLSRGGRNIPVERNTAGDMRVPGTHEPITGGLGAKLPERDPNAQIVAIQTVDENGMPVTKFVPKTVGQSYSKPQSAVTQNRLDSAKAVAQTGQDIIAQLSDPAFKATVGPAMGRANTLRDFIGNPPPEFSELAGQIESYALANMGVHGMRSAQGAEQIAKLLDKHHTPESLIATITGLNNFSEHFMENAGRTPPEKPSRTPSPSGGAFPAAGTERTVGGKVYVSDGAKFVPKGGG